VRGVIEKKLVDTQRRGEVMLCTGEVNVIFSPKIELIFV